MCVVRGSCSVEEGISVCMYVCTYVHMYVCAYIRTFVKLPVLAISHAYTHASYVFD